MIFADSISEGITQETKTGMISAVSLLYLRATKCIDNTSKKSL